MSVRVDTQANLVTKTCLFLLQHLALHECFHGIYSPGIDFLNEPHLVQDAVNPRSLGVVRVTYFTECTLPNNLDGLEVIKTQLRPPQPQEGRLFLPKGQQLTMLPFIAGQSVCRKLSLKLHTPGGKDQSPCCVYREPLQTDLVFLSIAASTATL